MENLLYLAVGLLLGSVIGLLLGMIIWKKPATIRPKPVSDQVTCGACRSPILVPPLRVVLTDNDAFRYFKCPQCGTAVTAPLPA